MSITDRAKESTAKLAWLDEMIRQYGRLQWACHDILELMSRQSKVDANAANTLQRTYVLTLDKLTALNEARKTQGILHDRVMTEYLNDDETDTSDQTARS